jgi:hypothetical protein
MHCKWRGNVQSWARTMCRYRGPQRRYRLSWGQNVHYEQWWCYVCQPQLVLFEIRPVSTHGLQGKAHKSRANLPIKLMMYIENKSQKNINNCNWFRSRINPSSLMSMFVLLRNVDSLSLLFSLLKDWTEHCGRLSGKLVWTFADRGMQHGQRDGFLRPYSQLSRTDY